MDIMHLIVREHAELRRELSRIAAGLAGNSLEALLDLFIEHITVHERMEHEYLFERAVDLVRRDTDKRTIISYEKIHTDLFELLTEFRATAKVRRPLAVRMAFLKFNSFLESHFSYEEEWLFPMIRQSVPVPILEEMAQEVRSRKQAGSAIKKEPAVYGSARNEALVKSW